MRTTVKVREKYQVTIPEDVREKIPLKVGERVEVIARGKEIVIHPVINIPRSQAWFWSKEIQQKTRKADENFKSGNFKRYKNIDSLINDLKDE